MSSAMPWPMMTLRNAKMIAITTLTVCACASPSLILIWKNVRVARNVPVRISVLLP